ncbi:hypothetical protein Pelo_8528 [Pelomyxa schiedti]|nr:hypothetical protein Pelo_8528 [Pelomyxa schiedti]
MTSEGHTGCEMCSRCSVMGEQNDELLRMVGWRDEQIKLAHIKINQLLSQLISSSASEWNHLFDPHVPSSLSGMEEVCTLPYVPEISTTKVKIQEFENVRVKDTAELAERNHVTESEQCDLDEEIKSLNSRLLCEIASLKESLCATEKKLTLSQENVTALKKQLKEQADKNESERKNLHKELATIKTAYEDISVKYKFLQRDFLCSQSSEQPSEEELSCAVPEFKREHHNALPPEYPTNTTMDNRTSPDRTEDHRTVPPSTGSVPFTPPNKRCRKIHSFQQTPTSTEKTE